MVFVITCKLWNISNLNS